MKRIRIKELFTKLNNAYAEMNRLINDLSSGIKYARSCKEFDDTLADIHNMGVAVKFDWSIDGVRYFPAVSEDGNECYAFNVTQTRKGHVLISAESEEAARKKVMKMAENGEIRLSEPSYSSRCSSTLAE